MIDESALADMAPALALCRIDPLEVDEVGISYADHFEMRPDLWRSVAIGVHARGGPSLEEPLP